MNVVHVAGQDLCRTFHSAITGLHSYGNTVETPAWNTKRKEIVIEMRVSVPARNPDISVLCLAGPEELIAYRDEVCAGTLDWAIAEGKEPYTYHDRLFGYTNPEGIPESQWSFIIKELINDKNSTRAVATILRPEDVLLSDKPCFQHIQFMIREERLYMFILFRSWDAIRASYMNLFALNHMYFKMLDVLRQTYPDLIPGEQIFRGNSFHAYETSWPQMELIARRLLAEDNGKTSYSYEEYFQA